MLILQIAASIERVLQVFYDLSRSLDAFSYSLVQT